MSVQNSKLRTKHLRKYINLPVRLIKLQPKKIKHNTIFSLDQLTFPVRP